MAFTFEIKFHCLRLAQATGTSFGDTLWLGHSHWLLQVSVQYFITVPFTLQDLKLWPPSQLVALTLCL